MPRSDALLSADPSARRPLGRLLWRVALAFVAIAALFVGGEFVQRVVAYHAARSADPQLQPAPVDRIVRDMAVNVALSPPFRDVPALLDAGLPVYDLRMDAKELRALHRTADEVMRRGLSLGVERRDHDAQLCIDDTWTPVRVKLRGLMATHYLKNHFSFRLKLPDRAMIGGIRELNLLEPYDKGLFIDPITHERLRERGLLTLRDRWAIVRLNGAVVGLFQEWEHFGRSLADGNGRPEGFIYGGDGQLFGKEAKVQRKAKKALDAVLACLPKAGALPGPGCGWALVDRYFDVDRLAWSAAMSSLLFATHTWNPDNLRLFWDPAWGRFEPIPWDYSIYRLYPGKDGLGETEPRPLSDLLLASGPMRQARDERLWTLLGSDVEVMKRRATELFEQIRPVLELDRRHLDTAADALRVGDYHRALDHNAVALRELLRKVALDVAVAPGEGGGTALQLRNHARSAVRIDALVLDDGRRLDAPRGGWVVYGAWKGQPGAVDLPIVMPAGRRVRSVSGTNLSTGEALDDAGVQLRDQVPALDRTRAALDLPESFTVTALPAGTRQNGRWVEIGPGTVELNETLEIPPGFHLRLQPGTTLRLGPDVALLLYGNLEALGTAEAPIRIEAIDPKRTFGAVGLLGRRTDLPRVHLAHLRVVGGRGAQNDRVFFTSAFALHGADIHVRDCAFEGAASDDGVNFKYARIDIERLRVERSRDDAFDCDFCVGEVRDSTIVKGGADGFDFSGSHVTLRRDHVQGCNDKGFSIGERTIARVIEGDVQGCVTGAASKDLSELVVESGHFRDLRVGFARYVKKGTFGEAKLEVHDAVRLERVLTPRLLETRGGALQPGVCTTPGSTSAVK